VQKLYTNGIGFVDAHLIASLIIVENPTVLWTDDDSLRRVAEKLGLAAKPPFAI
jgi:hypothetical protein